MADHPAGKSSAPQGFYGPPVPVQFISTNQDDGMQPLALVKRESGPPQTSNQIQSGASQHGVQTLLLPRPAHRTLGPATSPTVIVTTRTPIFIKSPTVTAVPRQGMMAHTQSTQSIAAVRPSTVANPHQQQQHMPPALVRIPAGSPRLSQAHPILTQVRPNITAGRPRLTQVRPGITQFRPGITQVRPGVTQIRSGVTQVRPGFTQMPPGTIQFRSIIPSPRLPFQRTPMPAHHHQPLRTAPPHRSPRLQTQTPPVAHMVNRTPPLSIRPTHHHAPFPAHIRGVPGPRVRSPPSTQQVRPMIVNTNSPLIRPGSVLTIPGNPKRIQASIGAMPMQQSSHVTTKGRMVLAHSRKPAGGSPATQLAPSPSRPVIFAQRHLLPANLKNQPFHMGKKVLVAVNPHGVRPQQGQQIKIQAKPVAPSSSATSPARANSGPMVVASPSQILVPFKTKPSSSSSSKKLTIPYTGKKRGRKKGSKNRPKFSGQGLKIRILPTTAVPGVPQRPTPPAPSQVVVQPAPRLEQATPMVQLVAQEVTAPAPPLKDVLEPPQQEEDGDRPSSAEVPSSEPERPNSEIPRAVVKPTILTHVIDGFIIEESKEPFPMPENSSLPLAVNADGTKTAEEPRGVKRKAQEASEIADGYLRCEFCGKMDFPRKFKRSKRFCSMACAKRYNVGCTKRLGLFSPKEAEKPTRVKHKMKLQGPKAKPLKGARGKYGRLKFNVTQPWDNKNKILIKAINVDEEGPPSTTSEETHSTSSSNATVSPLISEPDSMPFPDEELPPGLPGDPGSWTVTNVRDFIRSVPGCLDFAEEFHSQEIDGQALMLLKEDHLMTTMSMKLGPALKIISKINTLRDKQVAVQQ